MARNLELYLVRHGIAVERGPAWPDDTKRPLTSDGMARVRKAGRGLLLLGVSFDTVLSSPLVRARQTAELLIESFSPKPPIVFFDPLGPDGAPAAVLTEMRKQTRHDRVAIVGHEPNLGELAARLLGLRQPLEFKKGTVVRIDVDPLSPTAPGTLRWMLPPKVLRALGK